MELNRSAKLPGYDIVGHCRRETVGLLQSPAPESNNGRMFAKMFGVEAKATLSHAIRDVEAGNTVFITRHGKPVAALVRASDVAALERLQSAGAQKGLASIVGGWSDSADLIASIAASPRRGRRRSVSLD